MGDNLISSVEVVSLPRGLYTFNVRSSQPTAVGLGGNLILPGLHVGLGPGTSQAAIEFVSSPGVTGVWLYKSDDVLMLRIVAEVAPLLLTSLRLEQTAPLAIEIERLGTSGAAEGSAMATDGAESFERRGLRVQVTTHIQNRGDLTFLEEPWAGLVGQRLWIEAFDIVPRERIKPEYIEYKALDAAGGETEWVRGGESCGTRGLGVPLLGFAVRPALDLVTSEFDVEYFGRFVSGEIAGPARNGEPVFSSHRNDALECIYLAVLPAQTENTSSNSPAPGGITQAAKPSSIGPKFGVFRNETAA